MENDPAISETRRTSIYLSKELLKRLKNAAADREVSVNTILLEAIEAWFGWQSYQDANLSGLTDPEIADHRGQYFSALFSAIENDRQHQALKLEAERRGVSVKSLVMQAVDRFCSEIKTESTIDSTETGEYSRVVLPSATSIPQEFRQWVSYLLYILEENNNHAAPSIKNNLSAFVELTRLAGGKHAPPPGNAEVKAAALLTDVDNKNDAVERHISKHNRSSRKPGKVA